MYRFQLLYFFFQDTEAALHTVRAIGGELEAEGEQAELVIQSLHVRVVLFSFVQDEVTFTVQWL